MSAKYIVVGSKPWNERLFDQYLGKQSDTYWFIKSKEDLTLSNIKQWHPRYIFFLHWSWKVPDDLIEAYECVCFHMTDVPYGRGGSPLQNLILQGHSLTKLTALRMTQDFDAGPVYLKETLSLTGNAEEIYIRATELSFDMIEQIIQNQPEPLPQTGPVTTFRRRQPHESELTEVRSLQKLHDFIRMLDAEGYPKAFIQHQGFRYEFSRAAFQDGCIVADVTITPVEASSGEVSE